MVRPYATAARGRNNGSQEETGNGKGAGDKGRHEEGHSQGQEGHAPDGQGQDAALDRQLNAFAACSGIMHTTHDSQLRVGCSVIHKFDRARKGPLSSRLRTTLGSRAIYPSNSGGREPVVPDSGIALGGKVPAAHGRFILLASKLSTLFHAPSRSAPSRLATTVRVGRQSVHTYAPVTGGSSPAFAQATGAS